MAEKSDAQDNLKLNQQALSTETVHLNEFYNRQKDNETKYVEKKLQLQAKIDSMHKECVEVQQNKNSKELIDAPSHQITTEAIAVTNLQLQGKNKPLEVSKMCFSHEELHEEGNNQSIVEHKTPLKVSVFSAIIGACIVG